MDLRTYLTASLLLASSIVAKADTIIDWSIVNASFSDGGTLIGNFQVDATTKSILAYDIVTSAGTNLPGYEYTNFNSIVGFNISPMITDPDAIGFTSNASYPYLILAFNGSLFSPGALSLRIDNYNNLSTWECGMNNCFGTASARGLYSGSLSGLIVAAVPELGEWAMMLLGLPLLGWVVRRRQS